MNTKLLLSAIGTVIVLTSTQTFAREASEGPRGADNERAGEVHHRSGEVENHRSGEIESHHSGEVEHRGDDDRGRGRGRGRDDASLSIQSTNPIAREASEGPRGGDNERVGDRQNRGGRNGVSLDNPSENIIAREATEAPRGGDNERAGDRQRRGGRDA